MSSANASSISNVNRRFLMAAFGELALGMLALVLGWLLGPNPREHLPRIFEAYRIALGVLQGVVLGVALAGVMELARRIPLDAIKRLNQISSEQFREILKPFSMPQLITLALSAGVGEELLFRGWLQTLFTGPIDQHLFSVRVLLGIALASAAFGLAHPISRAYVIVASSMGIVFGFAYWYPSSHTAYMTPSLWFCF
jgi:uncharacterized protein